jgi:hypothetical protein
LLLFNKEGNTLHTEQNHRAIKALKDLNYSSRAIAKMVLGDASKKSTVNDYLKKINSIPTWPFYEQLTPSKESQESENYFSDIVDDLGYYSKKVYPKQETVEEHANQRVLLISDLHIPYQHQDAIEFLEHLKNKYNPTRVICLGDECDKHSLSFHLSNPDLPSAGDELQKALPTIAKLHELFPIMDVLASNHGSMIYRKAEANGLPKAYIKSYNDVLGVSKNWMWYNDLTITLPNGQSCYGHHGKASDVLKLSQTMGMNCYQGHYHESFGVKYWANPNGLYFALQTGCLVDNHSLAFNYNNVNLKKPIIGTALIIDSLPVLEPMVLDTKGRWIGRSK